MPTAAEIDHYRVFGFVVLRGLLAPAEVAALARETDAELDLQYRHAPYDGTRRHYCCMNDDGRTPFAAGLLQDPRFLEGGEALHGAPLLPVWSDANRYAAPSTHWHPDVGAAPGAVERAGVKYAIYLEPLAADSGALRVIPGSHRRPLHDAVHGFLARNALPEHEVPAAVCATRPGDVVAFHHALYHAACFARGTRRLCTVAAYAPRDDDDRRAIAAEMAAGVAASRAGFGWQGDVYGPAWLARAAGDPRRREVVARLQAAGIVAAVGGDVAAAEAALVAAAAPA